jgi:hypothetical protein
MNRLSFPMHKKFSLTLTLNFSETVLNIALLQTYISIFSRKTRKPWLNNHKTNYTVMKSFIIQPLS